jgi:anhydro-N-acetylmuramic acid kinase
MREVFAGVMSGTSMDGVDAIVADFSPNQAGPCTLLSAAHIPFAPDLAAELAALQRSGDDELARAARAANALADTYAQAIEAALGLAGIAAADVVAAGVHGQTLRHRPDEGWTVQLNNPARIAEQTGLSIVADFRSRDVAAGGEGAPLVPAFHAALFGGRRHRSIVNIGGIANVTDLPVEGDVRGFDTGPGNVLLDLWYARHRGAGFDRDGEWGRTGRVEAPLLDELLAEPYFARVPPKSTGRDLFDADWLAARLAGRNIVAADVQATLVALTARTIAGAIATHCRASEEVLVCGGGANNRALMETLASLLSPRTTATTAEHGVAVEHVEALAFAWLAREALGGRPGNLPAVTGARGSRVLGAIYPR